MRVSTKLVAVPSRAPESAWRNHFEKRSHQRNATVDDCDSRLDDGPERSIMPRVCYIGKVEVQQHGDADYADGGYTVEM